jgi:hypothetical protein
MYIKEEILISKLKMVQQVQDRQSKKLELAELTLNQDMGSEDQMSQRLQVSLPPAS